MEFVNVGIRIRPHFKLERGIASVQFISRNPPVLHLTDQQKTFAFDNVFDVDASQATVYESMVKPLVQNSKAGYNCTVFAYGQTGTGKTYTIGTQAQLGVGQHTGFIARAMEDFLNNEHEDVYKEISVSFCEIYNEKVFDLLGSDRQVLPVKDFKVCGLSKQRVFDFWEAQRLLEKGSKTRHVGETKQNSCSSRSHAIFTIFCNLKYSDHETRGILNLVDLAGSESARKTGNQGSQFVEGVNINKGLLCIGQVINALSMNKPYVPYRQSMITTILKDSLNRESYVTLVACISPNIDDVHETIQTLDFAQRVKRVKNKPVVNRLVSEYKKENPSLFARSAIKSTPWKRVNNHSYETPAPKRIILSEIQMNTFPAPNFPGDTSGSSLSHNFSNISSSTEIVAAKEASPESASTPKEDILKGSPWKQLEATVTRIVRRELQNLTMTQSTVFSSPLRRLEKLIHEQVTKTQLPAVKKQLDFDNSSPCAFPLVTTEPSNDNTDEVQSFKVPEVPTKRRKVQKTVTEAQNTARRRSSRLSLKKIENDGDADSTFALTVHNPITRENVERRRSVRVLERKSLKGNGTPEAVVQQKICIARTPKAKTYYANSPRTAHTKYILDVLNTGSEKNLQTLPTIGKKMAQQIYTYRKLNGPFKSFEEIRKMPFWRGNSYDRFHKANCLKTTQ